MMMKALSTPTAQLALGLLLGAAVFAAFAIGDDLSAAVRSAALVAGLSVFVYVGRRRSETIEVMSGIGDERTRTLYREACAFAGGVMAFVLPGWWLVTVAQGHANTTLSLLCAIFGVTWVAAAMVATRRG